MSVFSVMFFPEIRCEWRAASAVVARDRLPRLDAQQDMPKVGTNYFSKPLFCASQGFVLSLMTAFAQGAGSRRK